MAEVSTTFLNWLRAGAVDGSVVCEIYHPDSTPTADGFDPPDALECFAGISGITFRGVEYAREVKSYGNIERTITNKSNSASTTFSNIDRYLAAFALAQPLGIEGYSYVIRLISRSVSVDLDDSLVLFTGTLKKAFDVSLQDFKLSAEQQLVSIQQEIPPRKFSYDDPEGRAPTDVLFEGFRYRVTAYSLQYQERVPRGGLLGAIGFKKSVTQTLSYTSHSDLEANRSIPVVLGSCQMPGINVASIDLGGAINMLLAFADGMGVGVADITEIKTRTAGFSQPIGVQHNYGYPGGTNGQEPFTATDWPGNGYYSNTAIIACFVTGSRIEVDDAAPEISALIKGIQVPLPDDDGEFTLSGWTDNPAYLARFVMTHPRLMNIPEAFIDDAVCIETARYCDQFLEDEANTDRVLLPDSENGRAGTDYRLFRPTSTVTPRYLRRHFLDDTAVDYTNDEADYEYFDPTDTAPTLTPPKIYRRRYSVNVPITETQKAVDFLFETLFPAARLYVTQGANSKYQIRCKKPPDNTLLRADTLAGVTEIPVLSVMAWRTGGNPLRGKILIGANLAASEVRTVTDTRYSTAGNSITLAVSGSVTASGATFAGGDGADIPSTATLTVTGNTGTFNLTIDGIAMSYVASGDDTTGSIAAMLMVMVNAQLTLNRYIQASFDPLTPTVVTLTSKLGFLQFTTPLANAHASAQEVMRIAMAFSGGASSQADLTRSNIIRDSASWNIGNEQTYNRVVLKFRDRSQDFRLTELRWDDEDHIAQVKKTLPKEINGTAIQDYHQAARVADGILAELRDGELFWQNASDGEALLIDEGEVIAITHDSGEFVNLPVRVEKVSIDPSKLEVKFTCRRYLTSMYDDVVGRVRTVPLPTTLTWRDVAPPVPTNLVLAEHSVTPTSAVVRGTFDFGATLGTQTAQVFVKRDGEADFTDTGTVVLPDENNAGSFEYAGLPAGTHSFKVRAVARGLQSAFTAAVNITTSTGGDLEIDTLIVGTGLEFDSDAARDVTMNNLGALSERRGFLGL